MPRERWRPSHVDHLKPGCEDPGQPARAVNLNAAEQVELKLKTPWRDRTIYLGMTPLEFMKRLAAATATTASANDC